MKSISQENRTQRFLWTRLQIISGIKALKRNKIPLNSAALQKDRSLKTAEVLKEALGIATSGAKLLYGATRYYGTWDEALKKSGLNPQRIKKHEAYWTKELVIVGIKALHCAQIPLHVNAITKDNSPLTKITLKNAIGKELRGLKIHSASLRFFGSWYDAIQAAGFDSDSIRRNHSFWTKEVIINSVKALYNNNVPIYIYKLMRDKSKSTTDILKPIVGRPVTGSALYFAAMKKYGAWDKVLRASGIEPYEIRNDVKLWPKKKMICAIAALHSATIPLCVVKIEKDRSEKSRDIIYKSSHIRATGRRLHRISIKKFGSWDKALLAAKIDPLTIRRNTKSLSKEFIIRSIKKLHKNGTKLNSKNIEKISNRSISKVINPGKYRINVAMKLLLDSKKHFGSWDNALLAAGLNAKAIRRDKGFWTKQKIVDSILALDRAKIPMECMKMQFNKNPKIIEIISSTIGRKATGASLYGAVNARYGSWTHAVRAVKKNPKVLGSSSKFLSAWLVQKSIRNLYKAGLPLNCNSILKDHNDESLQILRKVTEGTPSTKTIYRAATKHFNTWDEALTYASLDPSKIRLSGMSVKRSGKPVGAFISVIQDSGYALNTKNILDNSRDIRSETYNQIGKVVSGLSVWKAGKSEFGDWETALRKGGLNPIDIVLRSNRKWSLSTITHQLERIETPDGGVRTTAYMGAVPKTPDEIMDETLIATTLEEAVLALPLNEQELTSKIFDFILATKTFSNQDDLILEISKHFSEEIPKERIQGIFQKLAADPKLLALL